MCACNTWVQWGLSPHVESQPEDGAELEGGHRDNALVQKQSKSTDQNSPEAASLLDFSSTWTIVSLYQSKHFDFVVVAIFGAKKIAYFA